MFDKVKGMTGRFQAALNRMKDGNFKALIPRPKIRMLMNGPEFLEILKTHHYRRLLASKRSFPKAST